MDFMRILQSLEEFLYEIMGWLVFYPRAIWRTLRHPVAVAVYTGQQLEQPRDEQFTEMVSPPLMLILTIVLAHLIELGTRNGAPTIDTVLGRELFSSEQMIIATRSVVFCFFGLFGAMGMLRHQRQPTNRDSLRKPFYIHCYLLAPFALGLAIASTVISFAKGNWILAGGALLVLSCLWYAWAQIAIYARILQVSWWRAVLTAAIANLLATGVIVGLYLVVAGVS
jgi:hypothetical protein